MFFAAGENAQRYWAPEFRDVLVSFASSVVRKRPPQKSWFLDSGAYSFFTAGTDGNVMLDAYIAFLLGPAAGQETYASMDVIGDSKGTWANDQKMRRAGLNPVAAVHHGEDHTLIQKYIDEGVRYIALGGYANAIRPREAMRWIGACFTHVRTHLEKTGELIKIHGFGMMDEAILLSFPFYSVDSTVWLISQRYGKIVIWDAQKVTLAQINPKSESHFLWAHERFGLPVALIDGALVDDARNLKAAWNIAEILDLSEFVTDIWTKRGIVWPDAAQTQVSLDAERQFLLETYPEAVGMKKPWKRPEPWKAVAP